MFGVWMPPTEGASRQAKRPGLHPAYREPQSLSVLGTLTACASWHTSVRVVSHLVSTSESYHESFTRAHSFWNFFGLFSGCTRQVTCLITPLDLS
jgi:hypothetical protein